MQRVEFSISPIVRVKSDAHQPAGETGISEEEAGRLIELIGTDWNSLLREARFLKGRH